MFHRMSRRRATTVVVAGLTLPLFAACASGSSDSTSASADDTGLTIMHQVPTLDNSYWADLTAGAEAAAEALGVEYVTEVYENSTDTQLSQVQQASSKGVDMAFLFAQDQASSPTLISTATDSGIYTTNIFSNQPWSTPLEPEFDGKYAGFFVPDNVADSENMARSIFEQMGGAGKVIHITGIPGNTTAEERSLGVEQALADYPDVEVVARESGGENRVDTQPVIENLLTAHPDVNAVICHNDDSAVAVLNALNDRGRDDVLVGGIDALDEFLDAMQNGNNAAATAAIHGAWFGGYNVVRAFDAYHGVEYSPVESMMFQDSLIIDTPEAAKAYQDAMYATDELPFDWAAMSKHLNPDDWDPQLALAPIDPAEYWGRIDEPQPNGYELPAEYAAAIDEGELDSVAETYLSAVQDNPLSDVIASTRSGQTTLGQK